MRVVLDVDGVVCDFVSCFSRWASHAHGLPHHEWTEYDGWRRYPAADALWDEFFSPGVLVHELASAKTIPGARFTVCLLRSAGHVIEYATYRPLSAAGVTSRWVAEQLGDPYATVHHVTDKALVPGDLYIDDHAETVEALLAASRTAYVFDQPWNRHLSLPRANGWAGVVDAVAMTQKRRLVHR